jgi:hypothetical protein
MGLLKEGDGALASHHAYRFAIGEVEEVKVGRLLRRSEFEYWVVWRPLAYWVLGMYRLLPRVPKPSLLSDMLPRRSHYTKLDPVGLPPMQVSNARTLQMLSNERLTVYQKRDVRIIWLMEGVSSSPN